MSLNNFPTPPACTLAVFLVLLGLYPDSESRKERRSGSGNCQKKNKWIVDDMKTNLDAMRGILEDKCFGGPGVPAFIPKVACAVLGNKAGIIGAANLTGGKER